VRGDASSRWTERLCPELLLKPDSGEGALVPLVVALGWGAEGGLKPGEAHELSSAILAELRARAREVDTRARGYFPAPAILRWASFRTRWSWRSYVRLLSIRSTNDRGGMRAARTSPYCLSLGSTKRSTPRLPARTAHVGTQSPQAKAAPAERERRNGVRADGRLLLFSSKRHTAVRFGRAAEWLRWSA
jgi:hypothetical protein